MANGVQFKVDIQVDDKGGLRSASVDVDKLKEALSQAEDESKKFCSELIKSNQIVQTIQNVTGAISQISGTLSSLSEEYRSFSGAMAAANTMAGKSGEDFQNLKNQVSELAKTVPIARDQMSNGLYQVISNGVPEDNWITYLEQSAKASVGGIADLEEAVKVTSTVIKNYGLSWDDAGTIQDKIQLTAKNGVTSFEQMAQALPRVTANAATLGVSVNELMATFATLTGVSGNTAEVSTQLGAIFTALVKPSSEAAQMAQQMGIQFDAAAIKAAGGMQNFLVQLSADVKKYASASGMLEQEIYGKLFGSAESLRALTPLTGNLADKFRENVEDMKGSADTIDEAFATMASTGSASLQLIKNKIADVTDCIVQTFTPALPFLNITSQVGMTLGSLATLAQAFQTLGVTTKATTLAIAAYNKTLTLAMGLSTAPLMAMAAALGVVAVGYSQMKDQIEDTDRKANSLRSTIADMKKRHDEETAAIRKYLPIAQDATKSNADRKEAIAKLKALYPDYFKNLDIAKSKQYDIADAVGAANKAYRDQLVLIAKQSKMQYEKSKVNYEKNQNGGQMGGTNAGMNAMMNQQDKANLEADRKLWKAAEQAVKDYDKALATPAKTTPAKTTDVTPPTKPVPDTTPTTTTSKATPAKDTTPQKDTALEGSITWYTEAISNLKKKLEDSVTSPEVAQGINKQISGLEQQLNMLKIQLGIESIPPVEVDKEAETVIDRINRQIENMKTDPIVIDVKGANKLKDLETLKDLENIDLSSFESVRNGLAGIKSMTDPTTQSVAAAGASCQALGQSLQQLGADSAAAKAGMIMAALGQIALSFATALNSASSNWITWLAFGIAGTAQMISMVSTISQFATGGIVGGNETSGDKVLVRVNSGEMILNAAQQARLFALADGTAQVQPNTASLMGTTAGGTSSAGRIVGKIRGRDIVLATANETRSHSRRSNIRL